MKIQKLECTIYLILHGVTISEGVGLEMFKVTLDINPPFVSVDELIKVYRHGILCIKVNDAEVLMVPLMRVNSGRSQHFERSSCLLGGSIKFKLMSDKVSAHIEWTEPIESIPGMLVRVSAYCKVQGEL